MSRAQFKHRYSFFTDASIIAGNYRVICKDLWWKADSYRHLKHRGGCTIPCVSIKCMYDVNSVTQPSSPVPLLGKQLFISNDRNRVRWAVWELAQERVCTDSFENFSVNSLKRDQSNNTKFNPPLFSLVNTFNVQLKITCFRMCTRSGGAHYRAGNSCTMWTPWMPIPRYLFLFYFFG